MRYALYRAVQVVWGLPQTLAGLFVLLAHARQPHFLYHGAIVTLWGRPFKSMSLGMFLFLEGAPNNYADPEVPEPEQFGRILVHEYGHSVQSLALGPLYLAVVGLPSVIWANMPALKKRRHSKGTSYYAFLPERNANWLGERVLKRPSMGRAIID